MNVPMRFTAVAIAAALFLSSVGTAWATEVHLGIKNEAVYDSNLFGSSTNTVQDGSFRFTPLMEVIQRFPTVNLDLQYKPSYETFINQSSINGFDHDALGTLHWKPGERTDVWLSDHFRRYHSLAQFNQSVTIGSVTSLETLDERNPFNQNIASGSIRYLISPRQAVQLFGSYTTWNYEQQNRRDFQVASSGLQYQYAMSEQLRTGLRLSWSRQSFDAIGVQPATHTNYYNLSPLLTINFDPTFDVQLSAGPTLVVSEKPPTPPQSALVQTYPNVNTRNGARLVDVTTCPTLSNGTPVFDPAACNIINDPLDAYNSGIPGLVPGFEALYGVPVQDAGQFVPLTGGIPSVSTTTVTAFANMSLTKRWDRFTFNLDYQRQQDDSSGLGVSSIADFVSGRLEWRPARRWYAMVGAGWIRRSQSQPQTAYAVGVQAANPPLCSLVPGATGQFCTDVLNAAQSNSFQVTKVNDKIATTTYTAGVRASYQMTRHITVTGSVWWRQQQNKSSIQASGTVDRVVARIGVTYQFDPFRF